MSYLSYLGSHWSLFLIVVLAVVGLGIAAWLTKNFWYVLGAVVLVIAGLAYQSSNIDGYKRKAAEDAQAQVLALSKRLLAANMSAALDAQRATADAYLNSRLDTLSRETPPNTGPCLDLAATRRVRAISGSQPNASPVPSRRSTGLFQRRSAAP